MTVWTPAVVARLALDAGFDRDNAAVAVAISWAATGYDDAFRWVSQLGDIDQRGLWALDVDAHPLLEDVNLWAPDQAAKATYGLWRAAGGSWDFHPTYRADSWRQGLTAAQAAVRTPDRTAPRPSALDQLVAGTSSGPGARLMADTTANALGAARAAPITTKGG